MTTTFYNGTSGDVVSGSTQLHVTGWQATSEATEQDTTNKSCGGAYQGQTGRTKTTFTFDAYYDGSLHGTTPLLFAPGTSATLKLERIDSDTHPITGTGIITSVDWDNSFDAVFKITCKGFFSGAVTLPSGTS